MKPLCLAAAFTTLLFASALAGGGGPQYRGMMVDAMGRSGTASITGPSALYFNPAGLAGPKKSYGVEAVAEMGFNGVLLDYADWANKNSAYLNNLDSALAHIDPVLENEWAPYSSNYMLQGYFEEYAFSVVRDAHYSMTFSKATLTPVIGASIFSDMQISAGRGYVLPDNWRVGIAYKFLYRQRADEKLYGLNDDEYYQIKDTWGKKSSNALIGGIDKITVASKFADDQYGVGVNLGVSRPLPYGFTVAASVLDLPTVFNGGFFVPQLNLGGSYAKDFGPTPGIEALHFNVLVNLDWQCLLPDDPWFKQWKGGLAVNSQIHNRDVISLATGLNDGYPTFGARAGYFLYAYYLYTAEETGNYPGQRKLNYHRFGVDFNF